MAELLRVLGAESASGVMEPGVHRALRDLERLGDLRRLEPLDLEQNEDGAMLSIELVEAALHARQGFSRLELRVWRLVSHAALELGRIQQGSLAPPVGRRDAKGDGGHIRAWLRCTGSKAAFAMDHQEDLLHEIGDIALGHPEAMEKRRCECCMGAEELLRMDSPLQ